MLQSIVFIVITFWIVYRIIRWAFRSVIRGVDAATELYDQHHSTSSAMRWNAVKANIVRWARVALAVLIALIVISAIMR